MGKFNFGKLSSSLAKILEKITTGISIVEVLSNSVSAIGNLSGKDKQDAVVTLVKQALEVSEAAFGKNLADDAEVEAASRAVIDAVVAFNNLIAKKTQ